jgi:putative Mg2+ transporter-C (MgtC) family protein
MTFDPKTLEIFGQLLLAVFLGITIGIEREISNKYAGMRTHALVAMGSALFTIASSAVSGPMVDPTRIAAQIVTGIGFLGAGLIVFHQSRVHGLTTAAGVWVAAAIGMVVGFKLYAIAVFATILTILIFALLWPIEKQFIKRFSAYTEEDGDR